jgi:hypothetical protein
MTNEMPRNVFRKLCERKERGMKTTFWDCIELIRIPWQLYLHILEPDFWRREMQKIDKTNSCSEITCYDDEEMHTYIVFSKVTMSNVITNLNHLSRFCFAYSNQSSLVKEG